MDPKEYILYERRTTITKAAIEIGCSRPHLTKVLNGKTPCGDSLAHKIARWSNKALSPVDLKGLVQN